MLRLAWFAARTLGPALRGLPREAAVALGAAGPGQAARPSRLVWALVIILPLALGVRWALARVTIVMSPSIEAWAVTPDPGPIARGDYVMFSLSHPLAGPTPVNVTKHALCLPGDRLKSIEQPSIMLPGATDAVFGCNGHWLARTKPVGRHHQRLAHFAWHDGVVPPGFAFVGSSNPDSFDSRYFGLVPLAHLTRMRRIL
jgi:conjugal transfer pilin signal peptidase TrbI